jgi:hypothetical protein
MREFTIHPDLIHINSVTRCFTALNHILLFSTVGILTMSVSKGPNCVCFQGISLSIYKMYTYNDTGMCVYIYIKYISICI